MNKIDYTLPLLNLFIFWRNRKTVRMLVPLCSSYYDGINN